VEMNNYAIKHVSSLLVKSRSRVMSTKRIILSPFTKEYRGLVATSGIRHFLEGCSNWHPVSEC